MTIQSDIEELIGVNTEIKRLQATLRNLKQQKQKCEQRIMSYLKTTQQPGVKYNGIVIMHEEKTRRKYKKKHQKMGSGEAILKKYGIPNSKEALSELVEALKGTPETVDSLKIY